MVQKFDFQPLDLQDFFLCQKILLLTSALLVVFLFFSFDSIFTCIYSNQFQSVPKTVLMSLFHLAYFP